MHLHPGCIIVGTALHTDKIFKDSQIFICEHNHKGTMGFIINKPLQKATKTLMKQGMLQPIRYYRGGPVEPQNKQILHTEPQLIPGGIHIYQQVYWGGLQEKAEHLYEMNMLPPQSIKFLKGYCGWDKGELENEMAEGFWQIADLAIKEIFR
jgi:putative transcriptional regulator